MKEIASAGVLMDLIKNVDQELKIAKRKYLERKADDFDMTSITAEQQDIHDKYVRKMDNMKLS